MYRRRSMGSVASQPPARRVSLRALAGVPVARRRSMGSVASQPPARRVFNFALGEDITTPTLVDPIARIDVRTSEILERQKDEQRQRRFALLIAGASALFAAARLGVIAVPMIKARIRS